MNKTIPENQKLSNPQVTIQVLKQYDFDFKKKYGQNFLIDSHVLQKIMDAAQLTQEDFVLEIGPGIGTMTQYLAERAGRVLAVEIDRAAIPILEHTLSAYDNVVIRNADVMKLDLWQIAQEYNAGKPIKVVANLPYYITTPIVMNLLESHLPISSITVMVQREVAQRMQEEPGSKEYGALSLAVQYYAQPYIAAYVPPNCFIPRPNVGSAVIRLTRYDTPPVQVKDEKLMFSLIRASFNQRRKTLQNGIVNYSGLSFSREQVVQALAQVGLDPAVRGERLCLAQFAQLSDALGQIHREKK